MNYGEVTYPDVEVQLTETDSNVYAVISRVSVAIRRAHGSEASDAFVKEAKAQKSYDEVLQFILGTVQVS